MHKVRMTHSDPNAGLSLAEKAADGSILIAADQVSAARSHGWEVDYPPVPVEAAAVTEAESPAAGEAPTVSEAAADAGAPGGPRTRLNQKRKA